jgi:hypothetical protein
MEGFYCYWFQISSANKRTEGASTHYEPLAQKQCFKEDGDKWAQVDSCKEGQ